MKNPSNPQLKQCLAVVVGTIASGFLCVCGQVVSSSGGADPTAAGFSAVFSAGPPVITTSSGVDTEAYWQLHTGPFPGDSGGGHYAYSLSPANISDPTGWTFTYRVKAVDADRPFESYAAVVANGGNAWIMSLVGGPNASPGTAGMYYYQASEAGTFPAVATSLAGTPDPSLAYHTYQIIYDGVGSASFYIDGTLLTTQAGSDTVFPGGVSPPRIEFGDGQGTGSPTGTISQWSLVSFDVGQHVAVVPEPSSIALLCLGGCSLFAVSFSRKRSGKSC